jgi:tRNA-splicing endonuclease subunit Sen15, fungi type
MIVAEEQQQAGGDGVGGHAGEAVEREWVLPMHLNEKWSLRQFAGVFDAVDEESPEGDGEGQEGEGAEGVRKKRRGGKRLLLAMLSDDSTVVYYVIHDGIVKPRQN